MFKKFLCGVAVATMMVSCGNGTAGDKANDSTATETKVEAEAPAKAAYAYEKTGNELLDGCLEMLSKIVGEFDDAKTPAEKQAILEKFGTEFGKWAEANAAEADKISDPAIQEKFMKETEKMTTYMTNGLMGDVNALVDSVAEEAK